MFRKLIKYIQNEHPYIYQFIYEIKVSLYVFMNKKNDIKSRKKKLEKLYKKHIGVDISWERPQRYTEKIQCRKIFDDNKIYGLLSDKYAVREYVADKIGNEYLIPLIGVWDHFDEINFSLLPSEFVLKTNNASGTNVIIRKNTKIDFKLLKKKFDFWINMDYANFVGYEMHYQLISPKIIAEELIKSEDELDLRDYKFLCFNGKVEYIWIDTGRYHNHKRTIYNKKWEKQNWQQSYYECEKEIEKPKNLEDMIKLAEILSKDFTHVRVDLYNNNGKIYFGEMTFTNAGGFEKFYPDSMDFKLGKMWKEVIKEKE